MKHVGTPHLLAREGSEQGQLALSSPPLQQGPVQVILVAAAAAKEQHALPKAGAASLLQSKVGRQGGQGSDNPRQLR